MGYNFSKTLGCETLLYMIHGAHENFQGRVTMLGVIMPNPNQLDHFEYQEMMSCQMNYDKTVGAEYHHDFVWDRHFRSKGTTL
jgi:hypothetical protein